MGSISFQEIFIVVIAVILKIGFYGAIAYGAVYLYNRMNKVKK